MTRAAATAVSSGIVGAGRAALGLGVICVVLFAFVEGRESNGLNPFDYFGFFTNLTSLLTSVLLVLAGIHGLSRRPAPEWLILSRAVMTTCMIIVGVVYNVLVPGTGSAPPWVSVTLHLIVPAVVLLDWVLIGDRAPLPWRRLWAVVPYPALWLVVVLVRGVTDGWVPYGFLLPERGALSMTLHVVGLLGALALAGALVWWASRLPGAVLRRTA